MNILLYLGSERPFTSDVGDRMSVSSFIASCKAGGFTDEDGYAQEFLYKGKIVRDEVLRPSDALKHKEILLLLERQYAGLEIVWYNA